MPTKIGKSRFVEHTLLLCTEKGSEYPNELTLDGYRSAAINSGCKVQFRSRSDYEFPKRYGAIITPLTGMRDKAVVDRPAPAPAAAQPVRRSAPEQHSVRREAEGMASE